MQLEFRRIETFAAICLFSVWSICVLGCTGTQTGDQTGDDTADEDDDNGGDDDDNDSGDDDNDDNDASDDDDDDDDSDTSDDDDDDDDNNDDNDNDDNNDNDDTDDDTDSDTGLNDYVLGDDECPDVSWGPGTEMIAPGLTLSNWVLPGYIDLNDDGVAEVKEVRFDLCWVNHTGKKSAVLVIGDTN